MTTAKEQEYGAAAPRKRNVGAEPLGTRSGAGALRGTVSFWGGFGLGNFGNEATLQAMLDSLRRFSPGVYVNCICTDPLVTSANYNIDCVPMNGTLARIGIPHNRAARLLRSIVVGIPNEVYRWVQAFAALQGTKLLIVPGTGLLTDAYGIRSWGPYSIFKWVLLAKLRGCKVLFVSVGAGPLHSRISRWLVRQTLHLADFRSYRDDETKTYLMGIGAPVTRDRVFPDLAFSIAHDVEGSQEAPKRIRPLVGLGLMLYRRELSSDFSGTSTYASYLEQLVVFVEWLLRRDYDIRLLIGELSDRSVVAEFKTLLKNRLAGYDEGRILDDPVVSVEGLLAQIAGTDFVVATRYHNVLLALALGKPAISISFHQKCTSLMKDMELLQYCQDIRDLDAQRLIEQFCQLEKNAGSVKRMIGERVSRCREQLEEQYEMIFAGDTPKIVRESQEMTNGSN